ncbi:hypothetical protein DFS34DRAFT_377796 [Phlyctochytrium arcticum]|nr:hypothetical protein DFS34DRAFT_377796 [Phlyctochytrium arcticum]
MAPTSPTYHLQSPALVKLLLHCAKFVVAPVFGLLLGTVDHTSSKIQIVDAIPLFHSQILTPGLEIGIQQAQIYADGINKEIVGVYLANQIASDTTIPQVVQKVASRVNENLGGGKGGAIILVFDAEKFAAGEIAPVTAQTNPSGSGWSVLPPAQLVVPRENSVPNIRNLIRERAYERLHDFDNYLEDGQADWLENKNIL